ncbi:hypothetical protein BDW60DRAFT_13609 [Aspergillus nidulans var. acristatus]
MASYYTVTTVQYLPLLITALISKPSVICWMGCYSITVAPSCRSTFLITHTTIWYTEAKLPTGQPNRKYRRTIKRLNPEKSRRNTWSEPPANSIQTSTGYMESSNKKKE